MPEIQFLFRFRDLVAATIEEHRRIIIERGWSWWGWWKRPSEDSRIDVWNDLASQASSQHPVPIGLFDSGSGRVYKALVTAVIKPLAADDPAADRTIRVPQEEAEHVPPYYRESPFSRAWMKLVEIDPTPIAFFNVYSFAEAPKLPNYADSTLQRFVRKRITNPEELRGMDTTIWRVQPASETDSREEIILSIKALTESISPEPVRCKADAILHLTDLHFAVEANRAQHVWALESEAGRAGPTLVGAVRSALESAQRKVGLIVISGDFTFVGSTDEFNEVRTAISHLLGILDLSLDHLLIVPGNHDIQWTTDASYDHNAEIQRAPEEAKLNYMTFYLSLLRHHPNDHLSMGRRYVLPCGVTVDICGVNSSSLQTGRHFLAGMGKIDEESFAQVANQFGWASSALGLRLLVIHHHLALTEDLEPAEGYGKGYGLAVDAVRVQRMATKSGVHLALHGHKHRAFIWRSAVYELPGRAQVKYRLGDLSIIGGGSAGSRETEGAANYFNLLTIEPGKLSVEMYRSVNRGIFEVFQRWDAELTLSSSSDGLKLGDWNMRN